MPPIEIIQVVVEFTYERHLERSIAKLVHGVSSLLT